MIKLSWNTNETIINPGMQICLTLPLVTSTISPISKKSLPTKHTKVALPLLSSTTPIFPARDWSIIKSSIFPLTVLPSVSKNTRGYVNPGFPLIKDDFLVANSAVYSGLTKRDLLPDKVAKVSCFYIINSSFEANPGSGTSCIRGRSLWPFTSTVAMLSSATISSLLLKELM